MLQGNGLIPVKLIFLDIDGVMLPFPSSSSSTIFSNEALTVLEHVVATTGAEIVLSSTWRMDESAIEIIYKNFETFPSLSKIKFKNWNRTDLNLHSLRAAEIKNFLENKVPKLGLQVQQFLVIDDEPMTFESKEPFLYFANRVIQTESEIGLCKEHLQSALSILLGTKFG
jgi:hypothetical protein|eukprot:g13315.t1